jgi:hypothetical protein
MSEPSRQPLNSKSMRTYNADNRVEVPPTQPKSEYVAILEDKLLELANEILRLKRKLSRLEAMRG